MIDVHQLPRASVSIANLPFSAAADLFVLHTNDFFGVTEEYRGLIIPISLTIAQRDGATISANEHIGVRVAKFGDATVTGTATGYSTKRRGQGRLGRLLQAVDTIDDVFTIDVMCGTLTTAAGGTEECLSDAWNIQIPYQYVWGDDQDGIVLTDDGDGSTDALVVRLENAPSAGIDINATLTVAFLGAYRIIEA